MYRVGARSGRSTAAVPDVLGAAGAELSLRGGVAASRARGSCRRIGEPAYLFQPIDHRPIGGQPDLRARSVKPFGGTSVK